MSEASGDSPKGIPINDLGIEQLSQLQKQIEQEMGFFQESATTLKALLGRNEKTIVALSTLSTVPSSQKALVPLSESMYVRAELPDPDKQLVEIGTGYFAELKREKAKAVFERKKVHILKQIDTIEGILIEKRRTRAAISDAFQAKVQAQLATMGPSK